MVYVIVGIVFIIYLIGCFINGYNESQANSYLASKEKERRRKNKK